MKTIDTNKGMKVYNRDRGIGRKITLTLKEIKERQSEALRSITYSKSKLPISILKTLEKRRKKNKVAKLSRKLNRK